MKKKTQYYPNLQRFPNARENLYSYKKFSPKKILRKTPIAIYGSSKTIMENIHLDLSEHEMDVMLNALVSAIENADEYEAGEYEGF